MLKSRLMEVDHWDSSEDKVKLGLREGDLRLLTEYVRWQRVHMSNVVKPTKSRSEINCSTVKLRRQKGTGRARLGSASSNLLRGGYKAHGPKLRLQSMKMNKKMRELAIDTALSVKHKAGGLLWMRPVDLEDLSSTKSYLKRFKALASSKVLFLTDKLPLGGRNVFNHKFTQRLGVYSILKNDYVVLDLEKADQLKMVAKDN